MSEGLGNRSASAAARRKQAPVQDHRRRANCQKDPEQRIGRGTGLCTQARDVANLSRIFRRPVAQRSFRFVKEVDADLEQDFVAIQYLEQPAR